MAKNTFVVKVTFKRPIQGTGTSDIAGTTGQDESAKNQNFFQEIKLF